MSALFSHSRVLENLSKINVYLWICYLFPYFQYQNVLTSLRLLPTLGINVANLIFTVNRAMPKH